ncbi:24198_t:CDS:2, partial [Entrophospora sp. SA101]
IKENYKFSISDKRVSANPDFVVDMKKTAIIVTEDKHLKNVSAPDFGEAQILAKILACGDENLHRFEELIHQTIYAIRVISSYVTFYKAEIPTIWPGKNGTKSGLDLAVPKERHMIFEAITKIHHSLLQSTSSTTTSTSHTVTSITAPVEQE